MLITVFTPTYNRAHLLPRLYESLKAQTFKDFEWLIVDDGSTDNTETAVNGFIAENTISICHIKQPNGGKHRAINRGAQEAKGELFFIVDSDDTLPENSIKTISDYWFKIRDDKSFGGVVGYMAHHNGEIIGKGCDKEIIDCNSLDLRYKYNVKGDMAEVFRTDVLRELPFPEHEGERFCPEDLVWNRIAQKYKLRVFHSVIYYRDYLSGGLTDKIVAIRMNSPIASATHYKELNTYNIPFKEKVKAAINYWRFSFCAQSKKQLPKLPWFWYWTMPLGLAMHLLDKKNIK